MFKQNKYTKWYHNIINRAKLENRVKLKNQYFESHHIIPKSLGGNNSKQNIVLLTAREHFIIHCLLLKMCINDHDKRKMSLAFYRMKQSNTLNNRIGNGKLYEKIKKNIAYLNSGSNNYFSTIKYFGANNVMSNPQIRKKHLEKMQSIEFKQNMSIIMTGENNPFYGKNHSDITKKKISASRKKYQGKNHPFYGKKHKIVSCEYCKKQISTPMYKRWHGANCKINQEN
jgi:hypothetical protein